MTRWFRTGTLLVTLVSCALALPACQATWTRSPEGGANLTRGDFTARSPAGWMLYEGRGPQQGALTLDGMGIHWILFKMRPLDEAFPNLERKATPDLLPSELAELALAELKAAGYDSLEVVSEGPAVVAGQEAFRLHLRQRQPTGLREDLLIYGFTTESGYYVLVLSAPTLHYFQRDEPVFENLVRSVRRTTDIIPSR